MTISVWRMTLAQCDVALAWRHRIVEAARGTEHEAAMAAAWEPQIAKLERRRAEVLAWRERLEG